MLNTTLYLLRCAIVREDAVCGTHKHWKFCTDKLIVAVQHEDTIAYILEIFVMIETVLNVLVDELNKTQDKLHNRIF